MSKEQFEILFKNFDRKLNTIFVVQLLFIFLFVIVGFCVHVLAEKKKVDTAEFKIIKIKDIKDEKNTFSF